MPVTTLATYEQVRVRAGYAAGVGEALGTHEAEILQILPGVTRAIENYCHRRFFRDTLTEYHHGNGGDVICLDRYPVESITSVKVASDRVFASSTALTVDTDYRFDPDNGLLYYELGDWPKDRRGIQVVYVAGYVHPDDSPTGVQIALPADLTEACIQQTIHMVNRRGNPGTSAERAGDGSVTYVDSSGLLKGVRDLLEPYVRVAI